MKLFKRDSKYSGVLVIGIIGIAAILFFQGYYVKSTYEKVQKQTLEKIENILSSKLLKEEVQSFENEHRPVGVNSSLEEQLNGNIGGKANIQILVLGKDSARQNKKMLDRKLRAISSKFGLVNDTALYRSILTAMEEDNLDFQIALSIKKGSKYTLIPDKSHHIKMFTGPTVSPIFNKNISYTILLSGLSRFIIKKMWMTIFFSFIVSILSIGAISLLGKNLRDSRKLLSFKKAFMRNMAHELKTPLSTLLATSELLTNPMVLEDRGRTIKYISYIRSELFRLSDMVEEILTNSELEERSISLNKQYLNLYESFLTAISRYIQSFNYDDPEVISPNNNVKGRITDYTTDAADKISLYLNIPREVYIVADPVHMEHVFGNLIENAIKYRSDKYSYLKISVFNKNTHTTILFEDNGIGVGKEYINAIFEPFFRVPEPRIELIKGYGLGLSYVKEIIGLHKGTITVRNNIPMGSIFEINIPNEGS